MRYWRDLLGGLLLWTAHFFAIYGVASLWPGTPLARILTAAVTLFALAICGWLSVAALRHFRADSEELHRWSWSLALLGYALAGVAIAYQGLSAGLA